MIPKVIYQTWYTKQLPKSIDNIIINMMEINPNYKHLLFDDKDIEDYICSNFDTRVIDSFRMLNIGAAKADFWRYLVLYKEGGIYLDIDSSIYSDLDKLISLNDKAIITRERNPNKFVQWCLMFESNSSILKLCIEKCIDNISNKRYDDILKLTGPDVFSQSVRECLDDSEIFFRSDDFLNKKYNEEGIKFYGFDYDGFCKFKNEYNEDLYTKPDWRQEQKTNGIFR